MPGGEPAEKKKEKGEERNVEHGAGFRHQRRQKNKIKQKMKR
jgi:hypothetical protein